MKYYKMAYIVVLAMIAIVSLHIFIELWSFISNSKVRISPVVSVSAGEPIYIELPEVKKYDRIYLVVDGRVNIEEISLTPMSSVQLPLKVETFEHDVFPTLISEKRYLFIAREDSGEAHLHLKLQPLTPYIIRNIEGLQRYRILDNCDLYMICVELTPLRFHVNNYTQIALIYPYGVTAGPDFKVSGAVKLFRGRVDYVNVILMTEKNWYAYKAVDPFTLLGALVSFVIDGYSVDLEGRRGEFLGEKLIAVAIKIGMSNAIYEEISSPMVGIGELVIQNNTNMTRVEPKVQRDFTFNPRIYALRKFQPSNSYLVSIVSLTAFLISSSLLTSMVFRGDYG